jgi:light-regulated signal transduction histidine kinase (bacteriophytochrome)
MPDAPRSDSELSEFLLRACHDLRGPLRALRIHGELLAQRRAKEADDDPDQSLAFVMSGAASAVAVVDGIADYALALAIDASRFQSVPLDVMVRLALAKLSARLRENGAEVAYENLPSVKGDADRLVQLFEYLVDHALRHCGSNPARIRISGEVQNRVWFFTVRDTCAGVAGEYWESAFTPFARLYANQRPGPGLATCRAIVERHGGTMWAEPDPGTGCILRFTLPASD